MAPPKAHHGASPGLISAKGCPPPAQHAVHHGAAGTVAMAAVQPEAGIHDEMEEDEDEGEEEEVHRTST